MNKVKKSIISFLLALIIFHVHAMDSSDTDQGLLSRLLHAAKENQAILVPVTVCAAGAVLAAYLLKPSQGSSLTVYNMSNTMILDSYTAPQALNSKKRYPTCSIHTYQSFWYPQSVNYTLNNGVIQTFIWRHVCSPYYKARLNLQEGERATLEILPDGHYKFKGQKVKADLLNDF